MISVLAAAGSAVAALTLTFEPVQSIATGALFWNGVVSVSASGTVAGPGLKFIARPSGGGANAIRALRSIGGAQATVLPLLPNGVDLSRGFYGSSVARAIAETDDIVGDMSVLYQQTGSLVYFVTTLPVRWPAAGGVVQLPTLGTRADGYQYGIVHQVSPNGRWVTGRSIRPSDGQMMYVRWHDDGQPQVLQVPPGVAILSIEGVNDDGVVAGLGNTIPNQTRQRGIRWTPGSSVGDLLPDLVPPGSTSPTYYGTQVYDVLPDGSVLGYQVLDRDGNGTAFQPRNHAARWPLSGPAVALLPNVITANTYAYTGSSADFIMVAQDVLGLGILADGVYTRFPNPTYVGSPYAISAVVDGAAYTASMTNSAGLTVFHRRRIVVTPSNVAPTVQSLTPVESVEGSPVSITASATDADGPGPITYHWTLTQGTQSSQVSNQAPTYGFTPADQGIWTISVRAEDGLGAMSEAESTTITVSNAPPSASLATGPANAVEGDQLTIALTGATDPGPADRQAGFSYAFDCGQGYGDFGPTSSVSCPATTDDGPHPVGAKVRDKDLAVTEYTRSVAVQNFVPVVTRLELPAAPVAKDAAVTAQALYTDRGTGDTHIAAFHWDWNLQTNASNVQTPAQQAAGSGSSASATTAYTTAGVYTVRVVVEDDEGDRGDRVSSADVPAYVVVYDPTAGFVTGGGWILSGAGDCTLTTACEQASGKANFGFVSKYHKGATTPSGDTDFEFRAGGFRFVSTSYEWLAVAGARAQFKGVGTVNGIAGFGFLLTAVDGHISGGGGIDKFRIKVWELTGLQRVVYDNQRGDLDDSPATTALGGGSIVIHTGNGK